MKPFRAFLFSETSNNLGTVILFYLSYNKIIERNRSRSTLRLKGGDNRNELKNTVKEQSLLDCLYRPDRFDPAVRSGIYLNGF